jgi:hypothetical protein
LVGGIESYLDIETSRRDAEQCVHEERSSEPKNEIENARPIFLRFGVQMRSLGSASLLKCSFAIIKRTPAEPHPLPDPLRTPRAAKCVPDTCKSV